MEASEEVRNALKQIATTLSLRAIEGLSSQLNPEAMMAKAGEILGVEMKNALVEILGDEESTWTSDLIDRMYNDLDASEVIEKIATPLTTAMTNYFKEETTDLIDAIVNQLDLDSLSEMVAEKVVARIQITSPG